MRGWGRVEGGGRGGWSAAVVGGAGLGGRRD